jgi:hypothetical protein
MHTVVGKIPTIMAASFAFSGQRGSGPSHSHLPPRLEKIAMQGNVSRATLPLLEGMAALEIPDRLSPESLEDLKDWMEVMIRRAERVMKRTQHSAPSESRRDNSMQIGPGCLA